MMMQSTKSAKSLDELKPPYVLALDVGTSSTRTLLFDANGVAVPGMVSQLKYELNTSPDGEVSVDAEMLTDVVAQTVDEVLKAAGSMAEQITAVALDTFWHSMMGVDVHDRPLTPVITWQDTRPRDAADELRKELNEAAVHERTGARLHASYWPAKLLWLAEQQPDTFERVAQWISYGEYLHRKFLGRSVCSLSMASGTGMLVTHKYVWDNELMQALQLRAGQLPKLGDLHDSVSGLKPEYARRWPALRDVPWFPALGDGATACIGSGCGKIGNWSLTMGTSSALRIIIPPELVMPSDGLWLYLVDAKRAVLGGALSEGGNVLTWLAHTINVSSFAEVEREVAALKPDEHGLTVLPFISGERSPGWHANARMTIGGISLNTTPAMLFRAGMEALAYQILAVYNQLRVLVNLEQTAPCIIASGGALLGSCTLQQIVADTLGVAIHPSKNHEASARGAALLALEAMGIIDDIAEIPPHLGDPVLPDAQRGLIYRRAARRQQAWYRVVLRD
jgi:gluconokinase